MKRAQDVKSEIAALCEEFKDINNPGPLNAVELSILDAVVALIKPFKSAAEILERRTSASGVGVTQLDHRLLLTTRLYLPESEYSEDVIQIAQNHSGSSPWTKLKNEIERGPKCEELFMLVRYLWAGKN